MESAKEYVNQGVEKMQHRSKEEQHKNERKKDSEEAKDSSKTLTDRAKDAGSAAASAGKEIKEGLSREHADKKQSDAKDEMTGSDN